MRPLRELAARLRHVLSRRREDAETEMELRFHLAMETEQNLRAGLPPGEAQRYLAPWARASFVSRRISRAMPGRDWNVAGAGRLDHGSTTSSTSSTTGGVGAVGTSPHAGAASSRTVAVAFRQEVPP